jgi:phage gp36-like protein
MIRPRVDPTTVSTDPILKRICLSIGVYDAWVSFARNQMPEAVRLDKEQAFKMLEKIQRGELEIIPDDATVETVEAEFSSKTQILGYDL